jgi:hypothetical protein
MSLMRTIVRVLGAAAVLAVLSLAPSVASAHALHVHVNHAHASASPAKAQPATPAVQPNIKKAAAAELKSAPALPSNTADDSACADRDCCSSGPCSVCCSMLTPGVPTTFPPILSSSIGADDAPAQTSLVTEALRRPPRSFV